MKSAFANYLLGSLVIVGLGAVAFWPSNSSCDRPTGKIVLIIDQTESISPETKESIKGYAISLIDKAQENTLISVRYLLAEGLTNEKLTFCRPISVSATTELNHDIDEVTENWNKFKNKFSESIEKKYQIQSASPIYRSLVNASREEFIGINDNKTLVIFSDLKDYVPGKTNIHDSCSDPESSSKQILSSLPIGKTDKPLDGISTQRYMIPRKAMNKQTIRCLVDVSDRITNELSGGNTAHLTEVIFLPESQ